MRIITAKTEKRIIAKIIADMEYIVKAEEATPMEKTKVLDIPQVRQFSDYDCGVACAQSILAYYGININGVNLEKLLKSSNTTGTEPEDIVDMFESVGLKAEKRSFTPKEMIQTLDDGIPVVMVINRQKKPWAHYIVAIGYNSEGLLCMDPTLYHHGFISFKELETRWYDEDIAGQTMPRMGIKVYGKPPVYSSGKAAIIH